MKNREIGRKLGVKFISVATMMALFATNLTGCGALTADETSVAVENDAIDDTLQNVIEAEAGVSNTTSGEAMKEEVVYVLADASGVTNKVIVSDWLKNPNADDSITDVTNLADIQNVSGDETYTTDENGNIVWNAGGNDIHYQGTTDATLPVDVKITYYLDGSEISPEEIAGKSGKVTIRFDYTNNATKTIEVAGVEKEIYVPFTMMSGTILDSAHFSNVEVTNGRVITSGSNMIVVGMAFPGLSESLEASGITDKIDDEENLAVITENKIPDYVEITADATDFEMNQTMTMAMSDVLSSLNLDSELDIDTSAITDSMDELADGADQLSDGTQALYNGSNELVNGAATFVEKTTELDNGAATLLSGAQQLDAGAGELKDGISKVDAGVSTLSDGASALDSGAAQIKSGAEQLSAGTGQLVAKAPELVTGAEQLENGSATLGNGLVTLNNGASQLYAAADAAYKMSFGGASWMTYNPGGAGASAMDASVDAVTGLSAQMKEDIASFSSLTAEYESALAAQAEVLASDRAAIDAALSNPTVENVEVVAGSNEVTGEYTYTTVVNNNYYYSYSAPAVSEGEDEEGGESTSEGGYSLDGSDSSEETATGTYSYSEYYTENREIYAYDVDAINSAIDKYAADYEEYSNIKASYEGYKQVMEYMNGYSATISEVQSNMELYGAQVPNAQYYLYSVCKGLYGLTTNDGTGVGSISKLVAGNKAITDGAGQLKAGAQTAVAGVNALDTGAKQLASGADTLKNGTAELVSGAGTLKNGTSELASGAGTLKNGTSELASGAGTLKDGTAQFKEGATELYNGTLSLEEGTKELMDGMFKFKSEGIDKLTDIFGDDVQDVIDTLTEVMKAGSDYSIFSDANSEVDSSVKFIYKTDAIK